LFLYLIIALVVFIIDLELIVFISDYCVGVVFVLDLVLLVSEYLCWLFLYLT